MSRELMLPRANNKNSVKVNVSREDDQEDIRMKMDVARKMQENQREC
jgi:multidrug efflux pump subunit AcrB